jgi:mono/diheme cytochrome c family protein
MKRAILAVLLIGMAAIVVATGSILRRGISTHADPTRTEVVIGRALRHFAVPAKLRAARNPLPLTPAVLAEGREHFADHCAGCHGNDGRGQTEIGKNLYPRAPDMTLPETQELSDGELFAIIRDGVRLTGMPGWAGDDADNWKLVHFVRHLPRMSKEEIRSMEAFNPVTREQRQEDEFLNGH